MNPCVSRIWAPLIVIAFFCTSRLAHAQPAELTQAQPTSIPSFQPFTGDSGYQEIRIDTDSWYVAFHGTRMHSMAIVEAAWKARAAQLCRSTNKRYLVELNYIGDRALDSDAVAISWNEPQAYMLREAGFVYIPIIIPSRSQTDLLILTPSKMGPVRCLATDEGLRQGKVAVDIQVAIDAGRKIGLLIP